MIYVIEVLAVTVLLETLIVWYGMKYGFLSRRRHSNTDAVIAKALEHNRYVDKHGGTYKSVVLGGRRY